MVTTCRGGQHEQRSLQSPLPSHKARVGVFQPIVQPVVQQIVQRVVTQPMGIYQTVEQVVTPIVLQPAVVTPTVALVGGPSAIPVSVSQLVSVAAPT